MAEWSKKTIEELSEELAKVEESIAVKEKVFCTAVSVVPQIEVAFCRDSRNSLSPTPKN